MSARPEAGERVWTSLELVSWTADYFRRHGVPQPRLDAEVLLAFVLGVSRLDLYVHFERPVPGSERERYRELVRTRAQQRVPVAYLTGEREFWSQRFRVSPAVLVPRPETELVVEVGRALAPRRVAEVGAGSGAITGALACELPDASFVAVDCSSEALEIAAENLARLGVAERVELRCGDGMAPLEGHFDLLVSNPPYVPTAQLEALEPEVRHEPRVALDGGPDGLDFVRRLARGAPELLRPGHLVLELGLDQAPEVRELLHDAGAKEVTTHLDLARVERVVAARFEGEV